MDAFNAVFSTTYEVDEKYGTHYHENFKKFMVYCQKNDLTIDGAMTDPDSDTAPDSQAPGDGSEDNAAANGPTGGQNDSQTDAGSGARNLPADGRADTASGRPGQLVRGTGTADMVTGDTPATDRGASRTAPGPQAA